MVKTINVNRRIYIDELNDNDKYVKCHGRLGYLSNFVNQKYNLMAALENINLTFPKLGIEAASEIVTQFERFHSWVINLKSEEKEEAIMYGLHNDYLSSEQLKEILVEIPYLSKWRIRVD
jgi:hypothetical protein